MSTMSVDACSLQEIERLTAALRRKLALRDAASAAGSWCRAEVDALRELEAVLGLVLARSGHPDRTAAPTGEGA